MTDDRTRIRNQITLGVVFGIWMVVRVFWNPFIPTPTDPKMVWGMRAVLVAGASMCFHLAWTKYWEYREKYPRT